MNTIVKHDFCFYFELSMECNKIVMTTTDNLTNVHVLMNHCTDDIIKDNLEKIYKSLAFLPKFNSVIGNFDSSFSINIICYEKSTKIFLNQLLRRMVNIRNNYYKIAHDHEKIWYHHYLPSPARDNANSGETVKTDSTDYLTTTGPNYSAKKYKKTSSKLDYPHIKKIINYIFTLTNQKHKKIMYNRVCNKLLSCG